MCLLNGLKMLAIGLIALPGFSLAAGDEPNVSARQTSSAVASNATANQEVAAFLYNCAHNEVEISKFVQSRLKTDEAREFATKMIKDHQQGAENFARIAGNLHTTLNSAQPTTRREAREERREEGNRLNTVKNLGAEVKVETGGGKPRVDVNTANTRTGENQSSLAHSSLDWNTIHRQIAEQGLTSVKKELEQKEGKHLDACYIGMQIAGHMKLQDELKVLVNHTSGELKQDIEKTMDTVAMHLKEAKQIMENQSKQNENTAKNAK